MYDKLRTLLFPTGAHTRLALALLILRLFVGIAFTQHGSGKLMHPSEFAAEFGIPVWLALITMMTQLIGGILLIVGILQTIITYGLFILFGVIAALFSTGDFQAALVQVGGTLLSAVVSPITTIAIILLYFDLRVRKEGLDLDQLAQQTSPGPAPA